MDRVSVAGSITINPPNAVDLRWDEAATAVTILPTTRWQADTYYTITVEPGALAASGRPMTRPARAAFLTRAETTTAVQATSRVGELAAVDTAFSIVADRPIDPATLEGAVTIEPAVPGSIEVVRDVDAPDQYRFVPSAQLAPGTTYTVDVEGLVDADGVPIAPVSFMVVTVEAPDVVRFRPRDKSTDAVAPGGPVRPVHHADGSRVHHGRVQGHGRWRRARRDDELGRGRHGPRVRYALQPAVERGRDDDRRSDGVQRDRRRPRGTRVGDVHRRGGAATAAATREQRRRARPADPVAAVDPPAAARPRPGAGRPSSATTLA